MSNEFFIVDKPSGFTSHDVVAKMRRICETRRVGHAGTLDPMATGVLIIGINRATRLLSYIAATEKEYEAVIRLGASTVTDDAEGEVLSSLDASHLSLDVVEAAMERYRGIISQVPSSVSAVKIGGKAAYARVRAGEDVQLPAREVHIEEFRALKFEHSGVFVDLTVAVRCSTGTFIRALARDLGADLGVGGHLSYLRRTRVGDFGSDSAQTLDDIAVHPRPISLDDMARSLFEPFHVDAVTAENVRHGRPIAGVTVNELVGIFAPDGQFLAIYEPVDGQLKPRVVFASR